MYTFILLVRFFFASAEMIIRRGLPAGTVAELLLLGLPSILVLTLPMSLLFGVLIAVGRLSADSELVAMRACGLSLYAVTRPMVMLGTVLSLLTAYVSIELMPAGNHASSKLMIEIATKTIGQQVEPRVVYYEFQGKALYIFDIDPGTKQWRGVFLADSVPGMRNEIVVADSGEPRLAPDGEQLTLHLEGATKHTVDLANPARYEVSRYRTLDFVLQDRFTSEQRAKLAASKSRQAMTMRELRRRARDQDLPVEERRLASVEMNKRYAIPAACLVFSLLAVPLGFNNRRGGKSSGFAISILVILFYWILLTQGEEAARVGQLSPALAMWLPDILLLGLGLVTMWRRDRDLPLVPRRLSAVQWVPPRVRALWRRAVYQVGRATRRSAHPAAATDRAHGTASTAPKRRTLGLRSLRPGARIVFRLPRLKLRFPNLLDRYVLETLVRVFAPVMLSAVAISLIADFTDNLDQILKNHPPRDVIFGYYKYVSLQVAYDTAPIVVLVTTLIAFSLLGRTNEITALKALGTSLFRLALPAVVAAGTVAALSILLQAEVLVVSNQKVSEYKDRIKGRTVSRSLRRADQHWVAGEGRTLYNYAGYDDRTKRLQRLQILRFDENRRLTARLFADSAQHAESGWIVARGWVRDSPDFVTFQSLDAPVRIDLPEQPEYFAIDRPRPEEMSYRDLRATIADLRASGQAVSELEVSLHRKLAFPFTSVVMACVALPFAFRLGRQGALYGLGLSVVLGIVFFAIYAFFMKLGEVGAFPAVVAVWSPSLLFALLSAYLFLGVRT